MDIDNEKFEIVMFDLFKSIRFKRPKKGHRYIIDFVRYCFKYDTPPLSIMLWYEMEGHKYNKTAESVERAIRYTCCELSEGQSMRFREIMNSSICNKNYSLSNSTIMTNIFRYMRSNETIVNSFVKLATA